MKRTLSILMTLLLLWSLALPAAAAETAATLRLEKTEGTVKVSNASGKSVSITNGMRLYSGYTITTEKNSYAYVSLDSTKAVKLDASSKVEVQKSGKKLELMLISGELFFNVTAPVEKDESLNIRTSTMVTGVRGTSGWVTVTNRFTSSVHLLEGTLTVTSAEPVTGQMRQVTITGGQTATATLTGHAQSGSQMALTVTTLQEKQVPGFVAVEVKKDTALQAKITALSPLSVPEIIGDAEERLEAEQASANAADQKIQQDLNKIAADEVDQVFQSPVEDDDDDDDDDGGSDVSSANTTLNLEDPTAEDLTNGLNDPNITTINVTKAGDTKDLSSTTYEVPTGKTLNIQSGTFTVGADQTLTVDGTMNISSGSGVTNNGTITIKSMNSLHILSGGSLTNSNTIRVGNQTNPGLLDIQSGGTLTNNGTITILAGSQLANSGELINNANAGLINAGTLTNSGTMENSGTFDFSDGELFTCSGTYTEKKADGLYAMVKNDDDEVSYLGSADGIPWDSVSNLIVELLNDGSGSLSADYQTISPNNMRLDLNGKQATLLAPLQVSGGSLTIEDSSGGSGSLAAAAVEEGFDGNPAPVIVISGGIVKVTGGKITSTGTDGTGIYVNGGTLTMDGGKVSSENDTGIYVSEATNEGQSNVEISGNAEVEGATYGILNGGQGSVRISGGTVTLTGGVTVSDNGAASGYPVFGNAIFGDSVKLRAKDERCLTPYTGTSAPKEGDYFVLTGPTTQVTPV